MATVKSICVYCGSSAKGPASHAAAAVELGRRMAENNIQLVYGGGRVGLMGILADAVLAAGGEVIGIIPKFLDELEVGYFEATRLEIVDSMHERKSRMAELSDAFAVLPGGLGTMDETFEILTWRQLGLHDKPILILDQDGYWTPAKKLIDHIIDSNYAAPKARKLVNFVDTIDDLFTTLDALPDAKLAVEAEKL